jgi:hypothetical protein
MKQFLKVNRNGVICLETREPGRISSGIARDLRFHIELHTNHGWQVRGEFTDPSTARQCFREQRQRNPSFRWRLVAVHEAGSVKLPDNWQGGYGSW